MGAFVGEGEVRGVSTGRRLGVRRAKATVRDATRLWHVICTCIAASGLQARTLAWPSESVPSIVSVLSGTRT